MRRRKNWIGGAVFAVLVILWVNGSLSGSGKPATTAGDRPGTSTHSASRSAAAVPRHRPRHHASMSSKTPSTKSAHPVKAAPPTSSPKVVPDGHPTPVRYRAKVRHAQRTAIAALAITGVSAAALPRPGLTPGAIRTVSSTAVCTPGSASQARDVPTSEADAVYARYGVVHVPYAHEVDHLVSLELGGSNAISNLWPEPYAGRWGARTKDALENRLHSMVCAGSMSLRHAQYIEATNWVAAYRYQIGTPPAPAAHHAAQSQTKPAPSNCEPGYSPCLPVTSDLNCADIPSNETPVTVTGSDPYGLDSDHNGYGCTS